MKKIFLLLILILIMSVALFGCSKVIIEDTIDKFQKAVNNNDVDALNEVMSPDSDFDTVAEYETFLQFFDGFTPLEYKNLDININGNMADVNADAYYRNTPDPDSVLFVMKKVDNFFSFIFPDWRILRYYAWDDFNEPVWRKIKKLNIQ